jgi:hypothetical protein
LTDGAAMRAAVEMIIAVRGAPLPA